VGSTLHQFWLTGDGVTRLVALLLLMMSIAAWVLILWKAWVLRRAAHDMTRAIPAFWAADSLQAGRERITAMDRERIIAPLVDAAAAAPRPGTLAGTARQASQVTRHLRDALHRSLRHLQWGQVVLASIGSTAPFIGLFGTVWGIYHALISIATAGTMTIDKVSGPVGEALIMTAAGLAVAIPAVLAYNLFGQWAAAREADLEGFALDLRELITGERSLDSGEQPMDTDERPKRMGTGIKPLDAA
jgi:biopolymer transport protein ExbB